MIERNGQVWLTLIEAAELAGVHRTTIGRAIDSGALGQTAALRSGDRGRRKHHVLRREVVAWMASDSGSSPVSQAEPPPPSHTERAQDEQRVPSCGTVSGSLTAFAFEGSDVRAVVDGAGEVWLVARDVFEALDLEWKGSDRLADVPEEWWRYEAIDTARGPRQAVLVSEPAVNLVAFRSRKPEAKRFAQWVAGEVLPTLARTGRYEMPAAAAQTEGDEMLTMLEAMAQNRRRALQQQRQLSQHELKINQLEAEIVGFQVREEARREQLAEVLSPGHVTGQDVPERDQANHIMRQVIGREVELEGQRRGADLTPEQKRAVASKIWQRVNRQVLTRAKVNLRLQRDRLRSAGKHATYYSVAEQRGVMADLLQVIRDLYLPLLTDGTPPAA